MERNPSAAPVEAILHDEGKKGVKILRWWGGMSWETLMTTNVEELLEHEPSYRPLEFDLPDDWEDGYLEPTDDGVKFVYGRQPKREDWGAKRWSRRMVAELRDSSLTPPIFVIEGHDVGIFESVADAQNQLEPQDVATGIFTGYDSGARRLMIETDGRDTRISLGDPDSLSPMELEKELRNFLVHKGEARASEETCDLECLVELTKSHAYRPLKKRLSESIGRMLHRG